MGVEHITSMCFHKYWYDAISCLPMEMQAKLYNAIFQFVFKNQEFELKNPEEKAIFSLIKEKILKAPKKYGKR